MTKKKMFTREDADKLLVALANAEGPVKRLLAARGHSETDHSRVCDALRAFADGDIDLPPRP